MFIGLYLHSSTLVLYLRNCHPGWARVRVKNDNPSSLPMRELNTILNSRLHHYNTTQQAWMMLRERLRRFLVAALLVTITSEQRSPCFICGYGYQVGSPLAKTSVQCHNFTSCTCNELALAGLEGSIPTENCSNVSSVIFSTCDCQENTTQNATPFTNPSDAPIAPTIYPASTPPTMTSVSVPTRPGGRSEIELDFLLSLFILVPCFCFCLVRCLMDNHATDVCRQLCTFYRAPARHYIEETQQNLPTIPVASPTVSIAEETQSRRPLVLAALFPKKGKVRDGRS